jgi:hypothetical protein
VLEGGAGKLGSPVEALEMYAEVRAFLEGKVAELVHRMRAGYDAPFSWDDIAGRLGISRQAWKKYRSAEEGVVASASDRGHPAKVTSSSSCSP